MIACNKIAVEACGCDQEAEATLISVEEALERIRTKVTPLIETEDVGLDRAIGRVLSAPIKAREQAPPFDNSAMDGYALRLADLEGSGPWQLPIQGRVAAGHFLKSNFRKGGVVKIFTGARVPTGADAVVMQEEVERTATGITINRCPSQGSHIRPAGDDMRQGQVILEAGRTLTSRDIAACAAAGHGTVCVKRPIRIAILVTGDEVHRSGATRDQAGIWDVNTPMLTAAMQRPDIELVSITHAGDTKGALIKSLVEISRNVDLIVTTGGISVGEEDHVLPAMGDLGAEICFSGVALKPGKPVSLGRIGAAVWLGLPGNPLSAFMTWTIFGSEILKCLRQSTVSKGAYRTAAIGQELRHKIGRTEFRLAQIAALDETGCERIVFLETTYSGRVAQLSEASGFIRIPAEAAILPAGSFVEFYPF